MIASWMLYATLVGVLIGAAAVAGERVASVLKAPARLVWVGAFLVAILWPALSILRALADTRLDGMGVVRTILPFIVSVQRAGALAVESVGGARIAALDATLLGAWGIATAVLLLRMLHTLRDLDRRRAHWRAHELDDVSVRISPDVGPAVVGLRHMEVVLPEWTLALDRPLRAMILRHEAEHRDARDPYVLFAASLAIVLMPWNIALWWQARRLRLAVELDCDARVLRAHPRPERYGLLLLAVAQRRGAANMLSAVTLAEPTSHLERRINAMRTTPIRYPRLRVLGFAAAATIAIVVACSLQGPDSPTGPRSHVASTADLAGAGAPMFEFRVEKAAAPREDIVPIYPEALRSSSVEGEVHVQFVVDATGGVEMGTFKVLKSTNDLFTSAVKNAVSQSRFVPAEAGGRKVKQLVQRPFIFKLGK